jgi:membrane protein involved in colicin uptake
MAEDRVIVAEQEIAEHLDAARQAFSAAESAYTEAQADLAKAAAKSVAWAVLNNLTVELSPSEEAAARNWLRANSGNRAGQWVDEVAYRPGPILPIRRGA